MMQCYEPDFASRTCRSLASYERQDGVWLNTAVVLLARSPTITLETVNPVEVRNSAVCGYLSDPAQLRSAKIRVNGRLLPAEEAAPVLKAVSENRPSWALEEICTWYYRHGNGFIARATVGGEAGLVDDQFVTWVAPDEGYVVASSSLPES